LLFLKMVVAQVGLHFTKITIAFYIQIINLG